MFLFKNNKKIDSNYLFVIGTGRSGTHFLGRAIGQHPKVKLLLEKRSTFSLVKKIAILEEERYLTRLLRKYEKIRLKSGKSWILEKSHPNIWLTEKLNSNFPNSYFLGIQRNVYQVVNSMMKHGERRGVRSWFRILPQEQPSRFLGINKFNITYYKDLPAEAKCVIRWLSHSFELERLRKKFPKKVLILDYTTLCNNFVEELDKVEQLIDVDLKDYAEQPQIESLTKFKNLSSKQLKTIDETLEIELPHFKDLYQINDLSFLGDNQYT